MGAYLEKPVTTKHSSHGAAAVGGREVAYASSAMQGWRVSMEDSHVIVPDLDESTSLLAAFDGHGGKEVAEYCSRHMPEMLQSNAAYKSGDLPGALRQLFMETDRRLLEEEVVKELKRYVEGAKDCGSEMEVATSDDEEAAKLLEEASMPLDALLAQYVASHSGNPTEEEEEEEEKEGEERPPLPEAQVKSMLQAIAGQAGIEIDFEDSSFSDDSEYENEEEEEEEAEGDGENKKEEQEEKEKGEEEEKGEEGGEKVAGGKEKVEGRTDKEAKEEGEGKDNTGNCGADGSSGTRSRENEHTNGLHGNTKTGLTSSEQVPDDSPNKSRPPLHQDSLPVSVRRVNGVADDVTVHNSQQGGSGNAQSPHSHGDSNPCDRDSSPRGDDKSPCDRDSSPRGDDKSPCDRDSSPRAAATTQSSTQEPSRNHTLLGLLTSAVSSPHNHRESVGVRTSRTRKREENTEPRTKGKKFCRGVLDEEGYHSGTTAVVCLLRQDSLTVANAGDSRCVVSCAGKAVNMSEDHKPTDGAELSRIQRAGGHVGADGRVNGGLNLSRAIGDHFYKENAQLSLEEQMITALPDVQSRTLQRDDEFIVLACDGIWNTKSSQEVVDFVGGRLREGVRERETQSVGALLETVCEELCDDCLAADTDNDGTGCDNMTVAIVLLSPRTLSLPHSSPCNPPS